MGDLTIQTSRWCSQNENCERTNTNSVGIIYHLTYGRHLPGPYAVNWNCTCTGFQYRGKCKHVVEAEKSRCNFGWEAVAGSPMPDDVWGPAPDYACPECGEPSSVIDVGA